MLKYKIFISSKEDEFEDERKYIKEFFENNYPFKDLVSIYINESSNPSHKDIVKKYSDEIKKCDIFINIFGEKYGELYQWEEYEGIKFEKDISPIHYEYLLAKQLGKKIIWFVQEDDKKREEGLKSLIENNSQSYTTFTCFSLIGEIYKYLSDLIINEDCLKDNFKFSLNFPNEWDVNNSDMPITEGIFMYNNREPNYKLCVELTDSQLDIPTKKLFDYPVIEDYDFEFADLKFFYDDKYLNDNLDEPYLHCITDKYSLIEVYPIEEYIGDCLMYFYYPIEIGSKISDIFKNKGYTTKGGIFLDNLPVICFDNLELKNKFDKCLSENFSKFQGGETVEIGMENIYLKSPRLIYEYFLYDFNKGSE